jgi:DtxR family transcriptional regulator, Mn-dependent transcriptional regulator
MVRLTQSQEDYLETIHDLAKGGAFVYVCDIAKRLDVAMPSVTGALRRLENMGFIRHDRYDCVELTPSGKRRGVEVLRKHALIRRFLVDVLGVPSKTAEKDACAIEHCASPMTVRAMTGFLRTQKGGE